MNKQDKDLIIQLNDSLKAMQPVQKDDEAEALIAEKFNTPDFRYQMVQALLLQKHAIDSLKSQVESLQQTHQQQSGGFFSGLFNNRPAQQQAAYRQPAFGQGSFLGSMASTALGVAGGMFLFNGISDMFSGHNNDTMNTDASQGFFDNSFQNDPSQLNQGFGTGDSFLDDNTGFDDSSNDFDDFSDF